MQLKPIYMPADPASLSSTNSSSRQSRALGHGDQFTDSFSMSSKKVSPSAPKRISSIRLSRKTSLNLS